MVNQVQYYPFFPQASLPVSERKNCGIFPRDFKFCVRLPIYKGEIPPAARMPNGRSIKEDDMIIKPN